jgi:hypothetical protein
MYQLRGIYRTFRSKLVHQRSGGGSQRQERAIGEQVKGQTFDFVKL